jgi:hypothetical protein
MTDTPVSRDESRFELRLVPPVGWGAGADSAAAPRLASLDGITLGLLSNGKANGVELLDCVADELAARYRIARIIRHTKPHPSLPMSDEVLTMFAEHAHAVLSAVGD